MTWTLASKLIALEGKEWKMSHVPKKLLHESFCDV